jgi:uncharacterized protein (DUF427 family)
MTVERVSSYPRPPRLEPSDEHILVTALGETLVETDRSLRVLETFHPPTYYLPPEAMRSDLIQPVAGRPSFCEWKGVASYFDVVVADQRLSRAVWTYPNPSQRFRELAGWYALYPQMMDGCWVDGERVVPQQGGFYGGWITSRVEGPFKGDPNHPELI